MDRSGHLPGALWKDCERKSGRGGEVMSPLTPGGEARAPALRTNSAKKPIKTSVKKDLVLKSLNQSTSSILNSNVYLVRKTSGFVLDCGGLAERKKKY